MIDVQQVCKTFRTSHGEVAALDCVSLSVRKGDFVAIQGHSGSGKSTLLSLVGGLAVPTSGRVEVAGRVISELSGTDRALFRQEKIGFVFQLFHLLPFLSVVDNVRLASKKGEKARAEELLARFDMKERLLHRPAQLSVGERQRVAMARALFNDPQLLLADEPTGNLDPQNASLLLDLLQQFRDQGGTILMATHDEAAASRADHTLVISRGKLESGV